LFEHRQHRATLGVGDAGPCLQFEARAEDRLIDRRKTPLPGLVSGCDGQAACRSFALRQRHVVSLQVTRVQHDGPQRVAHPQRDRQVATERGLRGVEVQAQLHA